MKTKIAIAGEGGGGIPFTADPSPAIQSRGLQIFFWGAAQ
jgi:hypothetical protein